MYLFLVTAIPIGILYVISDLVVKGTRSASWRAVIKGVFSGTAAAFLSGGISGFFAPRYEDMSAFFFHWAKDFCLPALIAGALFFAFYRYSDTIEGRDPPWTPICFHGGAFSMIAFFTFYYYEGSPTLFMVLLYPLLLCSLAVLIPWSFIEGRRRGAPAMYLIPAGLAASTFVMALVPWFETVKMGFWGIPLTALAGAASVLAMRSLAEASAPRVPKRPLMEAHHA